MASQDHGFDLVRVRAVATLTAAGESRQKIAEHLGISVPTVQRAKAHPDFDQLVAAAATRQVESLQPLIDKVSSELLEGMSSGIRALLDALDAEDAEGNPLWGVRQTAAQKLVESGVKLLPSGSGGVQGNGGGQGGGPAPTSITFNISPTDGRVSVDSREPKAIEGSAEDDE